MRWKSESMRRLYHEHVDSVAFEFMMRATINLTSRHSAKRRVSVVFREMYTELRTIAGR